MAKINISLLNQDLYEWPKHSKILNNHPDIGYIHFDVMDGHFVPNLALPASLLRDVSKHSDFKSVTHMMVSNPRQYYSQFTEFGTEVIIFHPEAYGLDKKQICSLLTVLKENKIKTGLAVNPETKISIIKYFLDIGLLDYVTIMSVYPGFSGQSFLPEVLNKIEESLNLRQRYEFKLEIDGGINPETLKKWPIISEADYLVVGKFILLNDDPLTALEKLKKFS